MKDGTKTEVSPATRAAILDAMDRARKAARHIGGHFFERQFALLYNEGRIKVPDQVRAELPTITLSRLRSWRSNVPESLEDIAAARAAIIAAYREAKSAAEDLGAILGQRAFVTQYNKGRVKIAPKVKYVIPRVGVATFRAWIERASNPDQDALKPRWKGGTKPALESRPKIAAAIGHLLSENPEIAPAEVLERLKASTEPGLEKIPSKKTIARMLDRLRSGV